MSQVEFPESVITRHRAQSGRPAPSSNYLLRGRSFRPSLKNTAQASETAQSIRYGSSTFPLWPEALQQQSFTKYSEESSRGDSESDVDEINPRPRQLHRDTTSGDRKLDFQRVMRPAPHTEMVRDRSMERIEPRNTMADEIYGPYQPYSDRSRSRSSDSLEFPTFIPHYTVPDLGKEYEKAHVSSRIRDDKRHSSQENDSNRIFKNAKESKVNRLFSSSSHSQAFIAVSSTISRDNTFGEEAKNAKLLSEFTLKKQFKALRYSSESAEPSSRGQNHESINLQEGDTGIIDQRFYNDSDSDMSVWDRLFTESADRALYAATKGQISQGREDVLVPPSGWPSGAAPPYSGRPQGAPPPGHPSHSNLRHPSPSLRPRKVAEQAQAKRLKALRLQQGPIRYTRPERRKVALPFQAVTSSDSEAEANDINYSSDTTPTHPPPISRARIFQSTRSENRDELRHTTARRPEKSTQGLLAWMNTPNSWATSESDDDSSQSHINLGKD